VDDTLYDRPGRPGEEDPAGAERAELAVMRRWVVEQAT